MKKWFRYLHLAFIIAMVAFIWGNSLKTAAESSAASSQVVEVVEEVLETINVQVETNFLTLIIRKLAHGTEFFVLGLLLILYVLPYRKKVLWTGVTLFIGVAVASIDETIQNFSIGRGPSIEDVGIDFLGFTIAVVTVLISTLLIQRYQLMQTKK